MHFSHFINLVQHIIEDWKDFEIFTTYKLPHQPSFFFFFSLNSKQSMNYFIRTQWVFSSPVLINSLSQTRWVPPLASNLKVNFDGVVI